MISATKRLSAVETASLLCCVPAALSRVSALGLLKHAPAIALKGLSPSLLVPVGVGSASLSRVEKLRPSDSAAAILCAEARSGSQLAGVGNVTAMLSVG